MSRKIPQFILLVGDPFLRRKKITRFLNEILPTESDRSFNFFRSDLKETSISEFIMQLKSFPMMGTKQLFVLDQLPKLKKDDLELLKNYLAHPAAWSYLIVSVEQMDDAHPMDSLAKAYGERVDCAQDEKRSSLEFVHERLKNEGKTISKEAWQYLNEKTGGNLTLLDSCVEKLLLYTGEQKQIDLEIVIKLTDQLLIFDTYDLTDAICAKDSVKALQVLRFLYDLEESAIMVIGLIHWQLKRLWQGKVILEEKGEQEVARTLRISPYRLGTFLNQVRKFSHAELVTAIDQLFDLDRKIKTGQLQDKEAIEAFVIQISTREQPARTS